jgi:hypothetical protein
MIGSNKRYSITVASGSWLYDSAIPHEVLIVRQNFDSFWDEGFEDEPQKLNSDGEVFHVLFCRDGVVQSTSLALMSLGDAIRLAESKVASPIHWDGAETAKPPSDNAKR